MPLLESCFSYEAAYIPTHEDSGSPTANGAALGRILLVKEQSK